MEELLEILKELHSDIDFENRTDLIDGKVLDSFDIVTLVAEINDVFDVRIPAKDLVPENFNSMAAIYAMIQRLDQ